jgi:hypothetical protein
VKDETAFCTPSRRCAAQSRDPPRTARWAVAVTTSATTFLLSTYCIIAFLDVDACASRARRSSEGAHRTTVLQQYSPRGICPKIANAFDPLRTDGDGLITHLVVTGIREATTLGLRGEH